MKLGNCKELILDLNSTSLLLQAFNMLIIHDQNDIPLYSFGQNDEYFLFSHITDLVVIRRTYNIYDVVLQL